jgi:hypothetical protein
MKLVCYHYQSAKEISQMKKLLVGLLCLAFMFTACGVDEKITIENMSESVQEPEISPKPTSEPSPEPTLEPPIIELITVDEYIEFVIEYVGKMSPDSLNTQIIDALYNESLFEDASWFATTASNVISLISHANDIKNYDINLLPDEALAMHELFILFAEGYIEGCSLLMEGIIEFEVGTISASKYIKLNDAIAVMKSAQEYIPQITELIKAYRNG